MLSKEGIRQINEKGSEQMKIRQAVKEDALQAAELIYYAIDDIAESLTGKTDPVEIIQSLADLFRSEKNRISYQNTIIADINGVVVGLAVTYSGDEAPGLDTLIVERLKKVTGQSDVSLDPEAEAGDYYIDTLSVNPEYQGQGIGTQLILETQKIAKQKGYNRISLNVSHDNPNARKLYSKLGFKKEKVIQINGHPYDYMVKFLESL